MKTSIMPFYLLSIVAFVTTLSIGLKHGHLGLTLFAITPYMMTFFLLLISRHHTSILTSKIITVFLVSVGLYFLLDTTYMERKLGDKFSFLFMPIWQWTMLMVSGFVIYLSNGKKENEGELHGS